MANPSTYNKSQKLTLGDDRNSMIKLVGALLMIYFLFKFLMVGYFLSGKSESRYFNEIASYLFLSSNNETVFNQPWSLLTYSWLHDQDLLFFGNMLWLAAFGYVTQDVGKRSSLLPNYIISSFVAGLIFIVANFFFAPEKAYYLNGSSPAILAIAATICVCSFNYRIFPRINGGIPLWILGIILVIIKTVQVVALPVSVQITYAGAVLWGVFYGTKLKQGKDPGAFLNKLFFKLNNLFNPDKKETKEPPSREYFYMVDDKPPFQKHQNLTQKRIDEILDKINQQGYRHLTDEEKKLLKRAADDEDI
ncbi:rhomboid family intramembrane serine protease [Gynurincola endophyticus]|uniref:rhomboid family intramembrane serine protease n=1 Tax=Gynurincola endophyticus TaxID=2479004 RepID=UPI000F8E6FDE|nr:rhomboid family intramembrane serine protease [Gynurincola endophyticus]